MTTFDHSPRLTDIEQVELWDCIDGIKCTPEILAHIESLLKQAYELGACDALDGNYTPQKYV